MAVEMGKLYTCDVCEIQMFCKALLNQDICSYEPENFENEGAWYHNRIKVFYCENSFLDVCPSCARRLSTLIDREVVKIRKEASLYDKRVCDSPASV